MKISGYTWAINAVKKLLPYEACIKSLLLLADEVYVTYDPRYDLPENFTQIDERVEVIPREFDVTDIQTVGQLLTDARQCCNGDWVIWLDLDEVLHEKDTDAILNLIRYAEEHEYTSLEIGFYSYISRKYTFPYPEYWGIRPKIMKNIEGVSHGIDSRWLQQRDIKCDSTAATYYLSDGDGIDFVKDGQAFGFRPLIYKDLPLFQKLKEKIITYEDIMRSTQFFPYIYHYARYSMQRKARMKQGDRLTFWVGEHDNYDAEQWVKDLESPVIMEYQKDIRVEWSIGEFEPVHPQSVRKWTELMDEFMVERK